MQAGGASPGSPIRNLTPSHMSLDRILHGCAIGHAAVAIPQQIFAGAPEHLAEHSSAKVAKLTT